MAVVCDSDFGGSGGSGGFGGFDVLNYFEK